MNTVKNSSETLVLNCLLDGEAYAWIFLIGFNKNERDNIDPDELEALQQIAALYLSLDSTQLQTLIQTDELSEVPDATN